MEKKSHSNNKKSVPVNRNRFNASLLILVLAAAGILYACNDKGSDFFASPTSFTTPDPINLQAPLLSSPSNGTTGLGSVVPFEWYNVDGADFYNFQLALTDQNFGDSGSISESGITENMFMIEELKHGMTYKWQVSAENVNGTSPFSDTWEFETEEDPDEPLRFEPGLYSILPGLRQPFGITNLGPHFAEFAAKGVIAISGETNDHPGTFVLFNPLLRVALQQWFMDNYVWNTAAAVTNPQAAQTVSAILAYGPWGLGLWNTQSPFPDTPNDIRTDFRVDDAVHAGGGLPTETIVFGSGDLGVGFIKFDPGLGRFAISDEILPKSDFFGDRIWAYVDDADAPAVVLARSQNSRLYFHKRDGGSPDLITAGLKIANSMRCLPPLCLVFSSDVEVPVFLFDGQNPPVRAADAELEFRPSRGSLMHTESGGIAALIVGRATTGSNRDRVTEVEFAADGGVIREVPMEIPNGCRGPNGVAYVSDEGGVVAIVTCTTTHNYFVARSALFPEL